MYTTFQDAQTEMVNLRAFRKLLFDMYRLLVDSIDPLRGYVGHGTLLESVGNIVARVYTDSRATMPTPSPSRAHGAPLAEKLRLSRLACMEIICAARIIDTRFHHMAGVGERAAQECTKMLNTPVFVRIRLNETAILLFVHAYKEMHIPRDISRLIGSVAWKMRYEEE